VHSDDDYGDDVHQRVFLRQAISCLLYGGWARLGWVWVGLGHGVHKFKLGQLFRGLGWVWVDEMDPQTTLGILLEQSELYPLY